MVEDELVNEKGSEVQQGAVKVILYLQQLVVFESSHCFTLVLFITFK